MQLCSSMLSEDDVGGAADVGLTIFLFLLQKTDTMLKTVYICS